VVSGVPDGSSFPGVVDALGVLGGDPEACLLRAITG
jgi:hypothetical protein